MWPAAIEELEQLAHDPNHEGSNPTTGTRIEKMAKSA